MYIKENTQYICKITLVKKTPQWSNTDLNPALHKIIYLSFSTSLRLLDDQ